MARFKTDSLNATQIYTLLQKEGYNKSEINRYLGVSRSTIEGWKKNPSRAEKYRDSLEDLYLERRTVKPESTVTREDMDYAIIGMLESGWTLSNIRYLCGDTTGWVTDFKQHHIISRREDTFWFNCINFEHLKPSVDVLSVGNYDPELALEQAEELKPIIEKKWKEFWDFA